MRAAAWGGFIVILRNEFRDDLGEFVAESRPVGHRRSRRIKAGSAVFLPNSRSRLRAAEL
jgi:hypothetical protein